MMILQCFDTVGWVIRPVKTVGHITYIVLVQTLNHAQSISQPDDDDDSVLSYVMHACAFCQSDHRQPSRMFNMLCR